MYYSVPYINLPAQYLNIKDEIDRAVQEVLLSGRFILGQQCIGFEEAMQEYLGAKHIIAVNSGTDALFLALKSLGIGFGDEIITSGHTFVATTSAIRQVGARCVLVDICDDYNIDASKIEEVITERTRAIIPVHLNGRACNMQKIMDICQEYGLKLIEDACQSLLAKYCCQNVGTFGIGCFSLHPLKILSAGGDGGFVSTNDDKIANFIRVYRNHAQITKDSICGFGYNSRLDEIQAAILRVKIKYLDTWIDRRREVAAIYSIRLHGLNGITLPPLCMDDVYSSYVIRVLSGRDELRQNLLDNGVETLVNWCIPLNKQKALGFSGFLLPKTELFSKQVLSLPINAEITDEQVEYVCDCIQGFVS